MQENDNASKVRKKYANFTSSGHSICVFIQYHHIKFFIIYVLPIIVTWTFQQLFMIFLCDLYKFLTYLEFS
jgi:hypothetical protein